MRILPYIYETASLAIIGDVGKEGKEYLADFLAVAPLSHALWRSVEAMSFSELKVVEPMLDLGCGFGEFSGVIWGKIDCGIDISERDLRIAMKGGQYHKLVKADARKLPFKTGEFRTVVSVSVLEHIEGVDRVLGEVSRILRKGGTLAFTVPTPRLYESLLFPKVLEAVGMAKLALAYRQFHKRIFQHVTLKDVGWWERALLKNGFKVVKKHGTVSRTVVRLHELFLLTAWPSQLWRWVFGKRLILFGSRAKILPAWFGKWVKIDAEAEENVYFEAMKI